MAVKKGTTFADVGDLLRYNRSVWNGVSPDRALEYGDNGLGAWGLSTVRGTGPCIALDRDEIATATGSSHRQPRRLVRVSFQDKTVECQVRDVAPSGICDLNPDAAAELGIKPPWSGLVDIVWI